MCVCVLGLDDDGDLKGNNFSPFFYPLVKMEVFCLFF